MGPKQFLLAAGLPAVLGAACSLNYTNNGLVWGNAIRMNQIQVVGSHNSYHVEPSQKEKKLIELVAKFQDLPFNVKDLDYGHDKLDVQLGSQRVRSLELDIFADPEGGHYAKSLIRKFANMPLHDPAYNEPGTKVMHIPDADVGTSVITLVDALGAIKTYVNAHPRSVPIAVLLEFSEAEKELAKNGGVQPIPWNNATLLDALDAEIRSVLDAKQLITPDDIRRPGMSLEESVLKFGWPDLDSARGRVLFLMDNGRNDKVNVKYREEKQNLEGRVMFTNSLPGNPECAFQKHNDPESDIANIQDQVKKGYFVRTMADTALGTVRACTTSRRDAAFKSGAQIVSSDFFVPGVSERHGGCKYVVEIGDGKVARCNPVNALEGCVDGKLE